MLVGKKKCTAKALQTENSFLNNLCNCVFSHVLLRQFKHFVSAHILYKKKIRTNNPFDHTKIRVNYNFFEVVTLNKANEKFSAMDI